jgi:hypothetical protein
MRRIGLGLALIVAAGGVPARADDSGNYKLIIDGKSFSIDLSRTITAPTKSGTSVEITLERSDIATYRGDGLSFQHAGNLSAATTDIDKDIRQILVTSALGTFTLVQRYDTMNPSGLADFMLNQIVGDDLKAGAQLDSKPATRTLGDGTRLEGLTATVTLGGDVTDFEVLTTALDKGGIVAVTRISRDDVASEHGIIDLFWQTFTVKAKAP